jgi:hypothetical protein
MLLLALAGCAGGGQQKMVAGFGTFDVAEDLELRVRTKGMTLIDYELRNVPMGWTLIADGLGRDSGPWFLYWDDSDRLWVHSRDTGTFVWVASRSGRYHRNSVTTGSPFLNTLPPQVEASLPRSAKRSLGIAQASE